MRQGSAAADVSPSLTRTAFITIVTIGALAAPHADAQQQTLANAQCMQERAGFSLNCTANDVSVAGVARKANGDYDIVITDPCSHAGDDVTFTATFDVVLTAQERHDIGIYFATDGDQNGDGALTSDDTVNKDGCSVSTLDYRSPTWVDLDGINDPILGTKKASGIQDTCGDIDDAHNPLKPMITVTAVCTDDDDNGLLDLPNCVSWRQSGANYLCTSPADTFPGAPSKCKCDAGFDVPVPVPANVSLVKQVKIAGEADSLYREEAVLDEPGGNITFRVTFSVDGTANTPDVTLNTLTDDVYGDITKSGLDNPKITSTTCSVTQLIDGDDGSYSCTFTVPSGSTVGSVTDTVTASATDAVGNSFSPADTAKVTVDNVNPAATLSKTPNPQSCAESELPCDVTFSLVFTNTSTASSDPLTITDLTDSPYGDVTVQGGSIKSTTCTVPQIVAPGGTYSCWFVVAIGAGLDAGNTATDTVTATANDDEGNTVYPTGPATVSITDVPTTITFDKSVAPGNVKEPGGQVTYTLTVTNESPVDSFTVTSLTDDSFGDVTTVQGAILSTLCVLPQVLAPGGSYSCTFDAYVEGNAGESHVNTATVSGTDDDGQALQLSDSAAVNFLNEPPAASLSKTATSLVVTYVVRVTNDSEAEALTLSSLQDDTFGDITAVQGNVTQTDCAVPQLIPRSGHKDANNELDDYYQCTFQAIVSTSPHTNTVTGTVDDDDPDVDAVQPYDSAHVTFGEVPDPN